MANNLIEVCASGGFNLTKFISNDVNLLLALPDEKRRKGVKEINIEDQLPTEKALGVLWDIPNDSFGFQIKFHH